jgi:histidinol-phosphate aminotransferase
MKIRKHLKEYRRDTYLSEEETAKLNPSFVPIDCEVGYSPFGCSPLMLEKIKNTDFAAVAAYGEMFYAKTLKPAILKKFAHANLKPKNIFFGHGSFNLAERVIHKFIEPTSMLGYGPQFNEVPSEMIAAGGEYVPITTNLKNFDFPLATIINELESDSHSVLYLDNPNNPTGNLLGLDIISELAKIAEKKGTVLLIDEAYGDFVNDQFSAFSLIRERKNLMVIRSFSKGLGLAAQRIGYMAVSDHLIDECNFAQLDVPFEPSLISAIMAEYVLGDADYLQTIRQKSRKTKKIIVDTLLNARIEVLPTHPDVSILLAHKTDENLYAKFLSKAIKVENGAAYVQTNPIMDNSFVRIRVPSEDLLDDLIDRIKQM